MTDNTNSVPNPPQDQNTDTQILHLPRYIPGDPELFINHLEAVLPISYTSVLKYRLLLFLLPTQVVRSIRYTFPVLASSPDPYSALRTVLLQRVANTTEERLTFLSQDETLLNRAPRQILNHILGLLHTEVTLHKEITSLNTMHNCWHCFFYSLARKCSYCRMDHEHFFTCFCSFFHFKSLQPIPHRWHSPLIFLFHFLFSAFPSDSTATFVPAMIPQQDFYA